MKLFNFLLPIICQSRQGRYRRHAWEYDTIKQHVGTGEYLNEVEITTIEDLHIRQCKRCGKKEYFNIWSGYS